MNEISVYIIPFLNPNNLDSIIWRFLSFSGLVLVNGLGTPCSRIPYSAGTQSCFVFFVVLRSLAFVRPSTAHSQAVDEGNPEERNNGYVVF